MSKVILRNRVSTEYKEVEGDSAEFYTLRAELHTDGRPRWEQTGQHDAAAFANRLEGGALRETDIGDAAQPLVESTVGAGVQTQLDYGWPTLGEIEQGAGRAADLDEEELSSLRASAGVSDSGQGYPAGHPPLPDEQATFEERVEEGISDDPLQTPSVPGTTEEGRTAAEEKTAAAQSGVPGGEEEDDSGNGRSRKGRQGRKSSREKEKETSSSSSSSSGAPTSGESGS